MTYEEVKATFLLEYCGERCGDYENTSLYECENCEIKKAIEALEYQIPKKVENDGEFGRCPVCGYVFNSELLNEYGITFCPSCSQRVDWSGLSE